MLPETLLGFRTIKKDMGDFWMAPEECPKIVGDERPVVDIGIKTAFPAA